MASKDQESKMAPFLVLVRAFFNREWLLTLDPAWFKNPTELAPYGLLLVQPGFWVPIKTFRLVPKEDVNKVVSYKQKARGILGIAIFLASLFGMGSIIELFGIYSRTGEHLALNVFMIGMILVLLPGTVLLWVSKDRVKAKDYPVAHISKKILTAKRTVNIAFWIFQIITIVLTAILQAVKVSAQRSGGNEEAIDIIGTAREKGTEKLPEAVIEVARASQQGESISSVLGAGILRSLFGGGIMLATTFSLLEILSFSLDSMTVFFLLFGLSAAMLIMWQVSIYRKYRVEVVKH